ncbi:MAG: DNA polymerase III subunit delta [Selenomonadaceae bacterium]|nr:DNA polymerase III subunit delta [Selenomonadaceae bacterium]
MKFGEFMVQLKKGVPHVLLLAGEERYYIDRALDAVLAQLFPDGGRDGLTKLTGDVDGDQLIGLLETVPFLIPKNVVVVEDTTLFRAAKKGTETGETAGAADAPETEGRTKRGKDAKGKSSADKKLERLQAELLAMPDFSYVIFVMSEKPDKRKKLTKTAEKVGLVLEAEPVRAWNINDWLQGKLQSLNKDLDRDAYEYFINAVSMMQQISLSYLDSEFDKIALFSQARRITKKELVTVFAGLPEVSVFALMDAISVKDAKKALALLTRQLADGTYFTVLLVLLARHVRQLWQVRLLMADGVRGKALAKPLGLHPFIAEKLGRSAMCFSDAQLRQSLLDIADADFAMKTGRGGNELLEHIVIELCA